MPLAGAPELRIEDATPSETVALLGADHVGLRPRILIGEGDTVLRGQRVIEDKATPGVFLTTPAGGQVLAIHRGAKRALQSMVIAVDQGDDQAPDRPGAGRRTGQLAAHAASGPRLPL